MKRKYKRGVKRWLNENRLEAYSMYIVLFTLLKFHDTPPPSRRLRYSKKKIKNHCFPIRDSAPPDRETEHTWLTLNILDPIV